MGLFSYWRRASGALAAVLACSGTASAETLTVSGIYPADSDAASALQSIAVETFGGLDGPALSLRIEDALRDVAIQRKSYFAVVPASAEADAQAVLRGTAMAAIAYVDTKQTRNRCVERDDDGKCSKRKDIEVDCKRRTVRLDYSARLVTYGGDLLYAEDGAPSQELTFCPEDDSGVKTVEATVSELVGQTAEKVRFDFAPYSNRSKYRVMESRKGLDGDAKKLFRDAVKLTKDDEGAACETWAGIEQAAPDHLSLVYNLGLCAEARGDLEGAETYYRRALALDPGHAYPTEGLSRVQRRQRAERQLAAHYAE